MFKKSEFAKPEFLKPGCLNAACTIYDFLGVGFLESEFSTPEGLRHAVMQSESPSLRTRSDFLKSKLLNIVFRSSDSESSQSEFLKSVTKGWVPIVWAAKILFPKSDLVKSELTKI